MLHIPRKLFKNVQFSDNFLRENSNFLSVIHVKPKLLYMHIFIGEITGLSSCHKNLFHFQRNKIDQIEHDINVLKMFAL